MIPLRDINPTRRRPIVTWALMATLTAVWIYQALSGDDLIGAWGMIPAELTEIGGAEAYLHIVTSMFIHAGWWHLLGNVWFLHVFGDNVEDELGRGPFLAFYLAGGLAAAATHVVIAPQAPLPLVGASGAIAGVLGAYLVLHPRARVVALVVVFFAELPAWVFLFVWFGLQLAYAFSSLGAESAGGGVAFFAHVGGFVTGVVMMLALRRTRPDEPPGEAPGSRIGGEGAAPRAPR